MATLRLLALPLGVIFFASATPASAHIMSRDNPLVKVDSWSGTNCQGSSTTASSSTVGPSSWFPNSKGNSFNVHGGNTPCKIKIWSGEKCDGSYTLFSSDNTKGCTSSPVGSVSLDCPKSK